MILHGNLAPKGSVAKISGHERLSHRGRHVFLILKKLRCKR